MLWPGTVIGAVAGYYVASIPGAMLGVLLGQVVDRQLQLRSWKELRERLKGRPTLRNDELLFIMLGRLAKADGVVAPGHIQQARQEMHDLGMSEVTQQRAIASFNRGKGGQDDLRVSLERLGSQPHATEGVLRACWRMAWADGRAGRHERELIVLWGSWLGWSVARVQALSSDYEPRQRPLASREGAYEQAMRLLGVGANTEPAMIKRAYRRLLSRHHPDKLVGAGASPAQLREATERTRELHNAYTLIREQRDFR
ncbi:TerB family tellurite resistance protein [Pseudomonas sp. dw_358]|uniref:TerB family tellurite resistance protein n=1 Tax=Pseudomonas sp. dw_358 TaxID=2720083 RepID=UPI001BD37C74|nr:TerB family tellurite resistance protein [Pseudomonas sp. dw_358]